MARETGICDPLNDTGFYSCHGFQGNFIRIGAEGPLD